MPPLRKLGITSEGNSSACGMRVTYIFLRGSLLPPLSEPSVQSQLCTLAWQKCQSAWHMPQQNLGRWDRSLLQVFHCLWSIKEMPGHWATTMRPHILTGAQAFMVCAMETNNENVDCFPCMMPGTPGWEWVCPRATHTVFRTSPGLGCPDCHVAAEAPITGEEIREAHLNDLGIW